MNVYTGLTLTALYKGKVNQFHISYSPFGRWEVEYESGYDLEYCDSFKTCKKLNKWIREFEQYKVTRRTKEDSLLLPLMDRMVGTVISTIHLLLHQ